MSQTANAPTLNDRLTLIEAQLANKDIAISNQQIEIDRLKHQAQLDKLKHDAELDRLKYQAEIAQLQSELLQAKLISNPPQRNMDIAFPSITIRVPVGSTITSNLKDYSGKDYEEFRISSPQGEYLITHSEPIRFKSFFKRLFSNDRWEYIKS